MKSVLSLWLLLLAWSWAGAAEFTREQAGKIALVVGKLLDQNHYKQAPLDNAISEMFLKNHLDALDYTHLIFLQSDVDQLRQRYGQNLDDLTLKGDAGPAYEIYELFLKRLEERYQLVQRLLDQDFDFTQDETFLPVRNKLPWPKDQAEVEQLWRARLKYELLQERLSKLTPGPAKLTPAEDDLQPQDLKEKGAVQPGPAKDLAESVKTIRKRYDRLVKTMREFSNEEILQTFLSALTHAYDPHSDYLSPTEAADFDINHVKLSLSGIGALLRWEDGYTRIVSLTPGGPAELSKQLKPNDRIIAVAQENGEPVDTVDMPLRKVVEMIRGPRESTVRLTIIPANAADAATKIVVLKRNEIKLIEQLAKAKIIEHPNPKGELERLGIISLPQFYENCAQDVAKLIGRLKKENIRGLILDLHQNGGGILDEAIALTGLFIKKGPVVQVKDYKKITQVLEDEDPELVYQGPLVVLVGRMSASASEIAAAALQDYGRALVIGDQATHGKGTVQTLLSLSRLLHSIPNPGKLKFTISKFYRVAGGTTQRHGVKPDIILPSRYDYYDIGEASLENSLPPDSIKPLEYQQMDLVARFVAQLQKNSKERISRNIDFNYIQEDIDLLKALKQNKAVSLNESKRLAEKREQLARIEARKKERAQRKPSADIIYELTLEQVDKNKALLPLAAGKQKEQDALAAINAAAAEPDAEIETDPAIDAQLEESLHILSDYSHLLTTAEDKVFSQSKD